MKTKSLISLFLLGLMFSSCVLLQPPVLYTYTYKDVGGNKVLTGIDRVIYLPGDTVVFIPSGRRIVIESVKIGNTVLKLNQND